MLPRTEAQDIAYWGESLPYLRSRGWSCINATNRWVFKSPSGSLHDLSAADFTKLDYIESNKLFLVEE